MDNLTTILGIFAGMLVGFYGIAKLMLNQATKDRDADRDERRQFSEAISRMAKATEHNGVKIAEAIEQQSRESAERNGHLGEQNLQIAELVAKSQDKVIAVIQTVKRQTVEEQMVQHQSVKESK